MLRDTSFFAKETGEDGRVVGSGDKGWGVGGGETPEVFDAK